MLLFIEQGRSQDQDQDAPMLFDAVFQNVSVASKSSQMKKMQKQTLGVLLYKDIPMVISGFILNVTK